MRIKVDHSSIDRTALATALAPLFAEHIGDSAFERAAVAGCDDRGCLRAFMLTDGGALQVSGIDRAVRMTFGQPGVTLLVMAHNHPCGTATPSQADIVVTRRMAAFARLGGGELIDHLLFSGGEPHSFRALGLI
jgi:DNA repair protein RadC